MKISVVTVSFNSADTIEETIRSVARQRYAEKEHIVIDGGSTDGTIDVLQRQATLMRWQSEPDRGLYDAMNKGFALASGDIVGFLNSDDFYQHAEVLSKVADVMKDERVDACYADLVYVRPHDTQRVVRYWKSREYQNGLCRTGWLPAHPTFFLRRRILEEHGGFDLEFPRQADFELSLRLFEIHHIHAVYVPDVWVRMRTGGVSNRSILGVIKGNIEAYRACRKNRIRVTPFFVFRKMLSRIPQFFV